MLFENHLKDMQSSGLCDPTIRTSGVYSVDSDEVKTILGFDPGGPGLAFPYVGTTNGNGEPFTRIKPDHPFKDSEGRPAKYLTAKGATNHLYIPPTYRKKDLLNRELPVILTEGEKKALKGAQEFEDFVVIALPGVWCFKTKNSYMIPDFKKIAWKGRIVYIVYDSDVTSKREVRQAEDALAAQLDRLGAHVYICRIPSAEDGSKLGLDDYLIRHNTDTFKAEVIGKALIWSQRGNIRVEAADDFLMRPIKQQEDIVGCGILPARSLAMVTAYSKEGKSLFVCNLGICIASGKPFLNQFPVTRRRRVLYFQLEISEKSMQRRLNLMLNYASDNGMIPGPFFQIVNLPPIKIDQDAGIKAAMRIIRATRAEVVIWDPLYKLHSLEENKQRDMRRVLEKFEYLRDTFGIAQLIVHHHGKPVQNSGRETFQLKRGSSALDDFGDSYLTLTRYKKKESSNYQRLSFTLRNAEEPEDLVLYRDPASLWYEVVSPAEKNMKVSLEDVVRALVELGGRAKRKALIEKLRNSYGASERTATDSMAEAHRLRRIQKERVGSHVEFSLHKN